MSSGYINRLEIARSQILDAVAAHLHGLGIARNMEIVEMEIFGLPKKDILEVSFKEIPIAKVAK